LLARFALIGPVWILLQTGLVFGQAPDDSTGSVPDSTKSMASCWTNVSRLGSGREIILYDRDGMKYKGDIVKVRDEPPLLSMKVYDSSQSRFVSRDFSPNALKRIEYRSADMVLPILGAVGLGVVGAALGKSWDENMAETTSGHGVLGGALLGALIGGMIGALVSPSTPHAIECP